MRCEPTLAEKKLWWKLRALKERGFHFRRQAPFRNYILDFVEHRGRVVIELDGGRHHEPEHRARDAVRDEVLSKEGYLVFRFSNAAALENLDGVVEIVVEALRKPPPTRSHRTASDETDLPTRGR
jgi:very-short-patch-repair endonuclease